MIKPDVIVSWPKNNDYPLWRKFIRDNRERFNKVIVVFMNPNQGRDYSSHVVLAMQKDEVTFLSSPELKSGEDWRNVAVHEALKHSDSELVWFTEQDFFPSDKFWDYVESYSEYDVTGVMQGSRIHPCSLFISKEILAKTCMDFSAGNGVDHFGLIQKDIENVGKLITFTAIPNYPNEVDKLYKHLNGLSHNWTLLSLGQEPNYEKAEFIDYLAKCLKCGVGLDNEWRQIAKSCLVNCG